MPQPIHTPNASAGIEDEFGRSVIDPVPVSPLVAVPVLGLALAAATASVLILTVERGLLLRGLLSTLFLVIGIWLLLFGYRVARGRVTIEDNRIRERGIVDGSRRIPFSDIVEIQVALKKDANGVDHHEVLFVHRIDADFTWEYSPNSRTVHRWARIAFAAKAANPSIVWRGAPNDDEIETIFSGRRW